MSKMIPTICGKNSLFVSDIGCTDCEVLEKRVKALEDEMQNKVDIDKIVAGENVTIERVGDVIVISSDCGCAGCTATKAELMNCLGVRELPIALTDTDNDKDDWYILGRADGESIGGGTCKSSKSEIMRCLGVREMSLNVVDTDNTLQNWLVLGRLNSESSGDGSSVSGYNCTKWEMLNVLGYQEIGLSIRDDDNAITTWVLLGRPII